MYLKIGDKVFIIDSKENEFYGECFNNEGRMDKWLGEVMTIVHASQGFYKMAEDNNRWIWELKMFDIEKTMLLNESMSIEYIEPGKIYRELIFYYSTDVVFRINDKHRLEYSKDRVVWNELDKDKITLENYRFVALDEWRYGDNYYTISELSPQQTIEKQVWINCHADYDRYADRNIFKTKEDAEKKLYDIMDLLKED